MHLSLCRICTWIFSLLRHRWYFTKLEIWKVLFFLFLIGKKSLTLLYPEIRVFNVLHWRKIFSEFTKKCYQIFDIFFRSTSASFMHETLFPWRQNLIWNRISTQNFFELLQCALIEFNAITLFQLENSL